MAKGGALSIRHGSSPTKLVGSNGFEKSLVIGSVGKAIEVGGKKKVDDEYMDIPDSEFYDFEKDNREECFADGQLWAVYDDMDIMPRSYAQIMQVFSPGFEVGVTWLEPDPDDKDEIDWVRRELPVSCGKFKYGKPEITDDMEMFSHLVFNSKISTSGSILICPRKGETWALFKNWDIKWKCDQNSHRGFEFEFVEILSDFDEESGVTVGYLEKVKGFVCLFRSKEGLPTFQIPPNHLYRFSHMAPSHRTTGEERVDVPKGYFELDPASLPADLLEDTNEVSVLPHQQEKRDVFGMGNNVGNVTRAQLTDANLHLEVNQPGLDKPTISSVCPSCGMKNYKEILERSSQCKHCMKFVLDGDLNHPSGTNSTKCPKRIVHQGPRTDNATKKRRNSDVESGEICDTESEDTDGESEIPE